MNANLDPQIELLRRDFAAARPQETDLEIYRLDWTVPLAKAQKRALQERRPLLVVAVRNAHGDTFTGHC